MIKLGKLPLNKIELNTRVLNQKFFYIHIFLNYNVRDCVCQFCIIGVFALLDKLTYNLNLKILTVNKKIKKYSVLVWPIISFHIKLTSSPFNGGKKKGGSNIHREKSRGERKEIGYKSSYASTKAKDLKIRFLAVRLIIPRSD